MKSNVECRMSKGKNIKVRAGKRLPFLLPTSAFLLCCMLATTAGAQQFPVKPVRVVNPAAPGGNSDIFFRILQPKMSELLGQSVIIDYRPGAGGTIGADMTAKSPPDGYTTALVAASFVINPSLIRKLP